VNLRTSIRYRKESVMGNSQDNTHEVVVVGVGGRGALATGQVLAHAGVSSYKHVLWSGTYFAAVRGAASDCIVVLSDEEIYCPWPESVEALIVLEPRRWKDFEASLRPGGVVVMESEGEVKAERQDIRVYSVPGREIARRLGSLLAANFVSLGAYIGITKVLSVEPCEQAIKERFSGERQELNLAALREGFLAASKL
jgi:2-oxoglutarate ferredoxin oxidoreductase subunit gamma